MISSLLHSPESKDINEAELVASCAGFLLGGNETIHRLLGNGLYALLHAPEQYQQLQSSQEVASNAIEEFLCFDSPGQISIRVPKVDIEMHNQIIKKGQTVFLCMGSANHDPNQFEKPDQLKINRSPNPHLTFGRGMHYCPGATLGCLEGKIAFSSLMKKFDSIEIIETPIREPGFITRGFQELNIKLR